VIRYSGPNLSASTTRDTVCDEVSARRSVVVSEPRPDGGPIS
jgi:hypothetical protein